MYELFGIRNRKVITLSVWQVSHAQKYQISINLNDLFAIHCVGNWAFVKQIKHIKMKTRKEVDDQIDKAQESIESGEGYHGMSYEEGVKAALE